VVANGLCNLGKKHNFSIFESSGVSWAVVSLGCAAHWSLQSKIFLFWPLSDNSFAKETPQKWQKFSVNWNLLCIGEFFIFLKQLGLLYFPVSSGGNFSVPSALQPSRTVTLCFDLVLPWQESPSYACVLLGLRL
jgi:hypothetical protein